MPLGHPYQWCKGESRSWLDRDHKLIPPQFIVFLGSYTVFMASFMGVLLSKSASYMELVPD
jgi:uracil-DNA glycosylase